MRAARRVLVRVRPERSRAPQLDVGLPTVRAQEERAAPVEEREVAFGPEHVGQIHDEQGRARTGASRVLRDAQSGRARAADLDGVDERIPGPQSAQQDQRDDTRARARPLGQRQRRERGREAGVALHESCADHGQSQVERDRDDREARQTASFQADRERHEHDEHRGAGCDPAQRAAVAAQALDGDLAHRFRRQREERFDRVRGQRGELLGRVVSLRAEEREVDRVRSARHARRRDERIAQRRGHPAPSVARVGRTDAGRPGQHDRGQEERALVERQRDHQRGQRGESARRAAQCRGAARSSAARRARTRRVPGLPIAAGQASILTLGKTAKRSRAAQPAARDMPAARASASTAQQRHAVQRERERARQRRQRLPRRIEPAVRQHPEERVLGWTQRLEPRVECARERGDRAHALQVRPVLRQNGTRATST
jgi:hypothetical protein